MYFRVTKETRKSKSRLLTRVYAMLQCLDLTTWCKKRSGEQGCQKAVEAKYFGGNGKRLD